MKVLFSIALLFFQMIAFSQQSVIVLGVAQDGGFPHIGCQKECKLAHKDQGLSKYVVSLALVDPQSNKWWLFEASPDLANQLQLFRELTEHKYPYLPEGIFLTHAHIGHYTGLMYLGREALNAKEVSVYALPRMRAFLSENDPWSQLLTLKNIILEPLEKDQKLSLNEEIQITTLEVPHRDEFSETAGFRIETSISSYLFIPDIDKWEKWDRSIVDETKKVKHAFIDATFFTDGELPNRPMSEVPHPFVSETIALFEKELPEVKKKVVFIHLNHTNPLLFNEEKRIEVKEKGYRIAEQGKSYN